MPDFPAAYDDTRRRLTDLLRSTSADKLRTIVPACPAWSIKDLLAHLVHVAETYALGDAPYETPDLAPGQIVETDRSVIDARMQEGVDARSAASLEDLLEEWEGRLPLLFGMMSGELELPRGRSRETLSWIITCDVATHYQDIRGALDLGSDPDTYATKLAYGAYVYQLEARALGAGVPPLRIRTQRGDHTIGRGEPAQTLKADWFDFLRTTSGRRSLDQIVELFGDIDTEPYLPVISQYPFPTEPIVV